MNNFAPYPQQEQFITAPVVRYENYPGTESWAKDAPGELPPTPLADTTSTAITLYNPAIAEASAAKTASRADYELARPVESGGSPLGRSARRIGVLATVGYSFAVGIETAVSSPTIARALERLTTTENGLMAVGLGTLTLAAGIAQEVQFYRRDKRKKSFDPISNESAQPEQPEQPEQPYQLSEAEVKALAAKRKRVAKQQADRKKYLALAIR